MTRGNHLRCPGAIRRGKGERATSALVAALLLAPLPAAAQAVDSAFTRGEILDTMTVENEADMDFGDILPGTANGTVVMTPGATATCATNNGIIRTGPCRAARFEGGLPFVFGLQVTMPGGNLTTLTGPLGATMRLRNFTFAKGLPLMLGGGPTNPQYFVLGGNFVLFVGGTLEVARTQAPGVYNGTFTLEFNYN